MRGGVWGVRHREGSAAQAERHLESRQTREDFCKKLGSLFLEENNPSNCLLNWRLFFRWFVMRLRLLESPSGFVRFSPSGVDSLGTIFGLKGCRQWFCSSTSTNCGTHLRMHRQIFWDHSKLTKPNLYTYLARPSLAPPINHPCASSRCTQIGRSRTAAVVAWFQAEARKRSTNPFDRTGNWRELGERREISFHNWAAGEWESK